MQLITPRYFIFTPSGIFIANPLRYCNTSVTTVRICSLDMYCCLTISTYAKKVGNPISRSTKSTSATGTSKTWKKRESLPIDAVLLLMKIQYSNIKLVPNLSFFVVTKVAMWYMPKI